MRAGGRSFERGVDYAASGQVARLTRSETSVEASVQGAHRYRVELWEEDGELRVRCSCLMGASGAFCKHCVATGLAALEAGENAPTPISIDDVRAHLGSLKKKELVELLIEEACEERLLDRLRLRVATGDDGIDMASFRDAIDRAVDPGGFISYAEAYDYSRTLDETVASLRAVLVAGHAAEAVELIEHCCTAIERAGGRMDDSDGHLSIAFDSLQRLHREACEQADFAPTQLAERLFDRIMATDFELFYDAAAVYAPLLGEPGRRRYAELVRAEWERLPALRPEHDPRAKQAFPVLIGDDDEYSERSKRFSDHLRDEAPGEAVRRPGRAGCRALARPLLALLLPEHRRGLRRGRSRRRRHRVGGAGNGGVPRERRPSPRHLPRRGQAQARRARAGGGADVGPVRGPSRFRLLRKAQAVRGGSRDVG